MPSSGYSAFPRTPLFQCIHYNRVLLNLNGSEYAERGLDNERISQAFGQSPRSGSFKEKIYSLCKYGLATRSRRILHVTELGLKLADEEQRQDVFAAFSSYIPFHDLYENLPANTLLGFEDLETDLMRRTGLDRPLAKRFLHCFAKGLVDIGMAVPGSGGFVIRESGSGEDDAVERIPSDPGKGNANNVLVDRRFLIPGGSVTVHVESKLDFAGDLYPLIGELVNAGERLADKANMSAQDGGRIVSRTDVRIGG
ncbi:hypothetical protein [Bifidobacterium sp. SO1]|uniref:hypothetical protein n=1 Tax=Bifidobacterium sp. SO1 TaxID=2809029 RepID=UPI001BDDC450|nr:hypothetical protein [Bifidobacterium sp. SO1]MBT1161712.1 hypothetical protein [Bifidobacterium sp. SO1]